MSTQTHTAYSLSRDNNNNIYSYTCIMYMTTKDWDTDRDGGALRLYLDSQPFPTPTQAVAAAKRRDQYVDISPINGRLLVFDSRLVHSVQRVTSSHKRRRALTLWINQPNNSGVRGEVYY